MYDLATRTQAIALLRSGVSNAEVGRRFGIPSGTIGHWLHLDRAKHGELPGRPKPTCPRCDDSELPRSPYAYLLGLYLGDGYIVQPAQHRVPNLTITCDSGWPGLIEAAEQAMRAVFPHNRTCRVQRKGCQDVKVYSKHLECLFPQRGRGKKHERNIRLESWQQEIVDDHPWQLVRGLIHSDGCRIINWTEKLIGGERKRYEYPRYFFTNRSDDIRKLFTDILDQLGVAWRQTNPFNISIARRASVELMDQHIGPKY